MRGLFKISSSWSRKLGSPASEDEEVRAIHKEIPWIQSPLRGVDKEHLVFAQRHEANTLELFFDLFFVANLATFTQYHAVTDRPALAAYVGFFAVIWGTWFQITLHDVRFARDTIYERACKTIQMVVFVGFALVGSQFDPSDWIGNNMPFNILSWTLFMSRILFVIQYLVVLVYSLIARRKDLILPLGLCVGAHILAAIAFGAMTAGFRAGDNNVGLISLWWVAMVLESITIISVSMFWRALSFKKTHLGERMGLLTLIVIGEGAIGLTKTVSKLLGKGIDGEGFGLCLCILLILVFIWMLYFDNQPHRHFGSIRQQVWALMHFPLHLAIVGIVEGSQQVAIARYVFRNIAKFQKYAVDYCIDQNLDGAKLRDKLDALTKTFEFGKKIETVAFLPVLNQSMWHVTNTTGICSPQNASKISVPGDWRTWPPQWQSYMLTFYGTIYSGSGIQVPVEQAPIVVAVHSWATLYQYWFAALLMLVVCMGALMHVMRRHKFDAFDWIAQIARILVCIALITLLAISHNQIKIYTLISGRALLPLVMTFLLIIILSDRVGTLVANWRNRKSGATLVPLAEVENGHHVDASRSGLLDGGHESAEKASPNHSKDVSPAARRGESRNDSQSTAVAGHY